MEFWQEAERFTDKRQLAKQIVGHSVLVRKSDQSLNPESVFWLLVLVFMFWWFFHALNARIRLTEERNQAMAARIAAGGNRYDAGGVGVLHGQETVTPTLSFAGAYLATQQSSYTPTPVIPTGTPSPVPTSTITMKVEGVLLKLSFYDPDIGRIFPEVAKVNCASWSFEQQLCMSYTVGGNDFHQWYKKGAACPPPMHIGDWLKVYYPEQLAGDWVCIDRGGAIQNGYVDFLLKYPDDIWTGYNLSAFPWSSTVQADWIHP